MKKNCSITFVDMAETLFFTFAKVRVLKNNILVKTLSNKEFNTYVLKLGETFDFSEFRDAFFFKETSIPVPRTMALIKRTLNKAKKDGCSRIVVLTAREDFRDKETFLDAFKAQGIDVSNKALFYIDRVGNLRTGESIAIRKKKRIIYYLESGLYRRCTLIEDDLFNISAFLELKKDLPLNIVKAIKKNYALKKIRVPITFNAIHVQRDGSLVRID